MRTRISSTVEVSVDPFEIECRCQRFADFGVGELRATRVEHKTQHACGQFRLEHVLDGFPRAYGREIIGARPVHRVAIRVNVHVPLLEGFEEGGILQEILDGNLVVILEANAGGNVLAPVVRITLEGDAFTGFHGFDLVRAGAEGGRQRRLVEGRGVDGMFGQNRRQCDDQRCFAIGLVVEGEPYRMLAHLLQFRDEIEPLAEGYAALVAQQLEGEDHIVRGHGLAIGPARLRVEVELDKGAILVPFHRFGEKPVERKGFVAGALHQRFENQIAVLRVPHAARRGAHAFENERVEIVEGAHHAIGDAAALFHVRVHVREVGEASGQGGFAVHGNAVQRFGGGYAGYQRKDEARDEMTHAQLPFQSLRIDGP